MKDSLLMLDFMRAFYWFDENLRRRLAERGWGDVSRSQSLVLTNVANGVTRPSRIASKLGITRSSMSQLLAEMVNLGLIELTPDPSDKRAQLVQFAPTSATIRQDAEQILGELEDEIERIVGQKLMSGLRLALHEIMSAL